MTTDTATASVYEKPGIYYDLPDSEYRAIQAWSPSIVFSGLTSMLRLRHDCLHPAEPKQAMIFGQAIHTSVLEPDLFPLRYVIWSGGRRAGRKWDEFISANAGKRTLDEEQYAACLGARNAVREHPAAAPLFAGTKTEVSVLWRDHATGLPCKGRVDLLGAALADLKTTTASVADDRALKRIASNLAYDMRMAAYYAGVAEHLGVGNVPPVKLIFVEQFPPHDVRVKTLSETTLANGWDKWSGVLERVAECEKSGVWPGCDLGESELEFFGGDDLDITLDGEPLM